MFEIYFNTIRGFLGIDPTSSYAKYIDSLAIFVTFFILSKLVVFVSQRVILKLTKKTKTEIDDLIVSKTNGPISIMLLFIGARLAMIPFKAGMTTQSEIVIFSVFGNIISSIITIFVTYIILIITGIFIDSWGRKVAGKTKSKIDDELVPIFHKISKIFFSLLGLLYILTIWGIEIGPLLASLGIAGVAVAFALQATLGNIFGGISLILDKTINVGDKIRLENGTTGTIMDIGLRSTKIKTFDNELIAIPSGKLADSTILNYLHPDPTVRTSIDFGVEYGADPEHVRKVVVEAVSKVPGVLKKPAPTVWMTELSDFALKFRTLFWIESFDIKNEARFRATEEIYKALNEAKINIPFPTRTVYMKKED